MSSCIDFASAAQLQDTADVTYYDAGAADAERAERGEGPEAHGTIEVDVDMSPVIAGPATTEGAPRTQASALPSDVVSLSVVRTEAVTEYMARLVTALRSDGAIVRRLLADEIASGKWDADAALPVAPPKPPAGLTPEQAARYVDATATAIRSLVAQASNDFVDANMRFFAHLIESMGASRGVHDDLVYAHASYVINGLKRWEPDKLGAMMGIGAIEAIRAAIARVSP